MTPSARPSVLMLSRYASRGASSRVRMHQYLPALRAAGFDVTVAPLLEDHYLRWRYNEGGFPLGALLAGFGRRLAWLMRSRRFDLLWIEYELLPWLPAFAERALALTGCRYIVEYDDAVFHRYDRHRSALVRGVLGRKIDVVMRHGTTVIAGNEYLAARARESGARDIVLLPSVVDTDRFVPERIAHAGPTVVGWIGSPATAKYLDAIGQALRLLSERGLIRVLLIGVEPGRVMWPFPCEERRWSSEREVIDLNQFDVGIMPVADDGWGRGKCGFKLIQYMACAKPVVASPVGANCEIVEHGVSGYLADTEQAWVRALEELASDPARRLRMGEAGRARVSARYALDVTTPRLIAVLRRAVAGPTAGEIVAPQ